jgi:hypothetical protein
MLKAYRPITLLWVVPFDIMVSLVDSLANLLLLRWRVGARHLASWLWNIAHLPSTIAMRRRFRQVRAFGDEELFRFQSRGSVRLREVGSELTDLILSVFDDDQALARGTRRIWSSPGIWGALLAAGIVLTASWSILFAGVPNTGFSFPFEAPTVAAERFLAGWNDSGLGSADAVHPSVGFTGLISLLWFGAEGAARTVATLAFAVMAVLGMGRLAGRLGFRGPGRYLSGLVALAGPGTALLVGAGSWLALAAAALLPWAVRSVILHSDDRAKSWLTHVGWALVWTILLTAVSPLLGAIPLAAAVLWRLVGGSRSSLRLGLATLPAAVVAVGFLYDDQGWLLDADRRLGLIVPDWWPVLIAIIAIPLMLVDGRTRRLGFFGAVVGLGGLLVVRLPFGGPGVEEAALILASFGSAVVVSAAFDRLSIEPRRLLAAIAATAVLVLSAGSLLDGRLGLPAGDANDRYAFSSTLADPGGAQRVLVVSIDRNLIPGEVRPGPGVWYRTLDGRGTTLDEVWLPEPQAGDDLLDDAIDGIAGGGELRPGLLLSDFSIAWVVVEGEASPLDTILESQLDLVPTPLAAGARVFENPAALPLAVVGENLVWQKEGTGFAGVATAERAAIRVNYSHGWGPEAEKTSWFTTVSAEDGEARFSAGGYLIWAPVLTAGLLVLSITSILYARLRR